jgi:hypothetical protein
MWRAISDERTRLSFHEMLVLASAVILGSESLGICDHILLSQIETSFFVAIALRVVGGDEKGTQCLEI